MDISIYKNYTSINEKIKVTKYDGKLFCCDSLLVILCYSGSGKYRFHINEIEVRQNEVLIVPPGMPFYPLNYSDNYHIDVLRIGEEHFELLDEFIAGPEFEILLMGVPHLYLSKQEKNMCYVILNYIDKLLQEYKTSQEPASGYISGIIREYMKIMFLECIRLLNVTEKRIKTHTHQGEIPQKFFAQLKKHFKDRENVKFYAREIGVNPKRLSQILYENTGKTASQWIDQFTLMAAKRMLIENKYKLQDISYDLNFATPSHFSKFFKTQTGMTPSQFKIGGGHA